MIEFHRIVPSLFLLCFLLIATVDSRKYSQVTSWLRPQSKITIHNRERRQVAAYVPGKPLIATSKAYQACVAPGGKAGHCKHMSACGDTKYLANFYQAANYMCIIEKEFIGICCPDDASNDVQNNELPVGGLAGSLPAIATEGVEPGVRESKASRGCGYSTYEASRVTGGKPTTTTTYPWAAAIVYTESREQYCGGVLITDRHVLTAAHCMFRKKPRDSMVRLGEYDFKYSNETRAIDFKIVEIRIHAGYQHHIYKNDIALLKVHRPTVFNTYIWPICLPPVGATFENQKATVIGWGSMEFAGPTSYILKEVTVPIWPLNVCNSKFIEEITSKQICAGTYEGNGDACQGDSGGPLMYKLDNGRWITIGVVSWGIGCGNPNKPGIYTRVNAYLDWIFANAVF